MGAILNCWGTFYKNIADISRFKKIKFIVIVNFNEFPTPSTKIYCDNTKHFKHLQISSHYSKYLRFLGGHFDILVETVTKLDDLWVERGR